STRAFHLRRVLRGRVAGYALALGVVGAVVVGAWMHSALVMLGGPILVGMLVLAAAFSAADGRAERDFFLSFAAARGLRYVGDTALLPLTPLLGAGDRRECRHWMEGPLGERMPGVACGLGHYTWFERQRVDDNFWPASPAPQSRDLAERSAQNTSRWVPHHFTICVVDLEPGIKMFPGVFLARRRGLAGMLGGGWLGTGTRRRVELESAQLHERYDLWVQRSQDDLLLRELFSPSFVAWLAEHPLEPCFEYRAGTLVVYLERRLEDAGRLGWLQDATEEIAGRLTREVAEAAA
ncbi:MAG: hypothetical protein ACRDLQ_02235, partial [Solirubrobacterales bacterium]